MQSVGVSSRAAVTPRISASLWTRGCSRMHTWSRHALPRSSSTSPGSNATSTGKTTRFRPSAPVGRSACTSTAISHPGARIDEIWWGGAFLSKTSAECPRTCGSSTTRAATAITRASRLRISCGVEHLWFVNGRRGHGILLLLPTLLKRSLPDFRFRSGSKCWRGDN